MQYFIFIFARFKIIAQNFILSKMSIFVVQFSPFMYFLKIKTWFCYAYSVRKRMFIYQLQFIKKLFMTKLVTIVITSFKIYAMRMKIDGWFLHLVLISPTFFARLFCTNILFSSYVLALVPKFCTKNMSIKHWWNWRLV